MRREIVALTLLALSFLVPEPAPGQTTTFRGSVPEARDWTRKVVSPLRARSAAAAAYHSEYSRLIVIGGESAGAPSNDTQAFDGFTWRELLADDAGNPPSMPSQRSFASMAGQELDRMLILFGGRSASALNDVWQWDGQTWTSRISDTATPGTTQPSQRWAAAFAYDRVRSRLVLFGGVDGSGVELNHTWEWEGTRWIERQATDTTPGQDQPGPREAASMAYSWSLDTGPAGASPFTSAASAVAYDAYLPGTYVFSLSVLDSQLASGTANVTVTIADVAPVASAGLDRQVTLSRSGPTAIQLDGRLSSDANREPLAYGWSVESAPDRGAAAADTTTLALFDSRSSPTPTVTFSSSRTPGGRLAAAGLFRFRLTVTAGALSSTDAIDVVAVDPLNLPPSADAGLDRHYILGSLYPDPLVTEPENNLRPFVRLDGRESADSFGAALTYSWTLLGRPAGSAVAAVADASSATPVFVPDRAGEYVFELTVSNGRQSSAPDAVTIGVRDGNTPPAAVALAQDLASFRTGTVLTVAPGVRVTLDASRSVDPDPADRAALSHSWRQQLGPTVELQPGASFPAVSFVPLQAGVLAFELTVTDPGGALGRAQAGVVVTPAPLPRLSLSAEASTTTATGESFEAEPATGNPRSLRVTIPTTVTLAGRLTGAVPGARFRYEWRQLAGPRVLLDSTGENDTTAVESMTAFSPTTSRVHLFELRATELETGVFLIKRIRVVVDLPGRPVPSAIAGLSTASLASAGPLSGRTIALEAFGSGAAGRVLTYSWRQLAGPLGTFENPFAPRTVFTAPEIQTFTPVTYLFELTVDAFPPGDRSTPVILRAEQGPAPAGPILVVAGENGGCGIGRADGAGMLDLLVLLLPVPLGVTLLRGRTRPSCGRESSTQRIRTTGSSGSP